MTTALLIIDVQNAMCVGEWAAFDIDPVVDRINALSQQARMAGVPVVLVQHEEAQGPLQVAHSGWALYERLLTTPQDWRIRKTGSDAFFRTPLHAQLQAHAVDHLVVCGLQSEFCVDSTVRAALALGYAVTLVADAHTTLDNAVLTAAQISAHHNATLAHLGSYGPRMGVVPADRLRFDA